MNNLFFFKYQNYVAVILQFLLHIVTAKQCVKIAQSLLRHLNGAIFTHYLGNKINYSKTLQQPFFNQDLEKTIELRVTKKKREGEFVNGKMIDYNSLGTEGTCH